MRPAITFLAWLAGAALATWLAALALQAVMVIR